MTHLRILPFFMLLIACLLLAVGFMIATTHDGSMAKPIPAIITIQSTPVQPSIPRWITIDPIGDKKAGENFTIVSTTNLSASDEILVAVETAQIRRPMKSSTYEFSGCQETVKVNPGRNGNNSISFTISPSVCTNLIPMEYLITETDVIDGTMGVARFNITP